MGDRQKIFDDGGGMIRQGDRAQTNYRRSETLPSDLRATMEENVKAKAEELSWDSIAKKHVVLYSSLLEN